MKRATILKLHLQRHWLVSIHAPVKRATGDPRQPQPLRQSFNPRPREEGDKRRLTCKPHGIENCLECRGVLKYSVLAILWWARYQLRGANDAFIALQSRVKKFAAICTCEMCGAWRNRFMEKEVSIND